MNCGALHSVEALLFVVTETDPGLQSWNFGEGYEAFCSCNANT